jgi:hypothetical protein
MSRQYYSTDLKISESIYQIDATQYSYNLSIAFETTVQAISDGVS